MILQHNTACFHHRGMQHNEDSVVLHPYSYTLPLQSHKQGLLPFTVLLSQEKLLTATQTCMIGYMPRGTNEAVSHCILSNAKQRLYYFCMRGLCSSFSTENEASHSQKLQEA